MKLKVFFLGMFAAAALLSCNNDVIDDGNQNPWGNVKEGIPVYASVSFKVFGAPNTYAGTIERPATADETTVLDVAMYVYKSAGLIPEAAVYAQTLTINNETPTSKEVITLRATSGTKKIFIAANPDNSGALATGPYFTPTTGLNNFKNNSAFDFDGGVNATLFTNATAWNFAPTTATITTKADGLIRSLARGDIYGTAAGNGSAGVYTGSVDMLMTNWDGPVDGHPITPYPTTSPNCEFVLVADIDSVTSQDNIGAAGPAVNHFRIDVQRAFAKVSVRITADVANSTSTPAFPNFATTANFSNEQFIAGDGKVYEGVFQPWAAADAGAAIWNLGNINKETLPFQKFAGTQQLVADPNYTATDDSIHQFSKWVTRYDNTRVFPDTITAYHPNPGLVTADVKRTMITANNFTTLTPANNASFNYAYATENAREMRVTHDFGTYIVIGGRYNPAEIITGVDVNTLGNAPAEIINGRDGAGVYGTAGAPYSEQLLVTDEVYYIAKDGLFVLGLDVLMDYYARVLTGDKDGDPTDPTLVASVQQLIADKDIWLYKGGQCWYRVFINDTTSPLEPNATRRNHIYAINITEFQGPGIADPNDILIPNKPITEADTYVTAYITALPWHEVEQDTSIPME